MQNAAQATTCIPIERQVPTTPRVSSLRETCARWSSCCLSLAISYAALRCIWPATPPGLPVSPDPFSRPAACFTSHAVGGDLTVNVKLRSLLSHTHTGPPCQHTRSEATGRRQDVPCDGDIDRRRDPRVQVPRAVIELLDKVDRLDSSRCQCWSDRRSSCGFA